VALDYIREFEDGLIVIDEKMHFRGDLLKTLEEILIKRYKSKRVDVVSCIHTFRQITHNEWLRVEHLTIGNVHDALQIPCPEFINDKLLKLAIKCRHEQIHLERIKIFIKYKNVATKNKKCRLVSAFQKVHVNIINEKIVGIEEEAFFEAVLQTANENTSRSVNGLNSISDSIIYHSKFF
ncbi:MAG: hypothetical protein AABY22_24335, partial [Nanoarchaeota archaeon]